MNIDLFRAFHELLNQRWKEFGSPVVIQQLHVHVATACIVYVEENADVAYALFFTGAVNGNKSKMTPTQSNIL